MKKISLTLFSIFGIALLSLFLSLLGCDERSYRVAFMTLESEVQYGFYTDQTLEELDTCDYKSGFISLKLIGHLITASVLSPFENSAFAFQRAEPNYTSVEKIVDFKVVSLNNYNANISAGDEISDQCLWGLNNRDSLLTKEEVILKLNDNTTPFTWIDKTQRCKFRLNEAPGSASEQQFALEVTLEHDTKFRDTTIAFVIRP